MRLMVGHAVLEALVRVLLLDAIRRVVHLKLVLCRVASVGWLLLITKVGVNTRYFLSNRWC